MKILLTRSSEENLRLEKILKNNYTNSQVYSLPLLEYKDLKIDFRGFSSYLNFIITSKFAAQLVAKNISHNCIFFVVGASSADIIIKNTNIQDVKSFNNVRELKEFIHQSTKIKYLYLAGDIIKEEFDPALVTKKIIYKTVYAKELGENILSQIRDNNFNIVLLYSLRNAKVFLNLMRKYNLLGSFTGSLFITISDNVADYIKSYNNNLYVESADYPNENSILEKLKTFILYDKEKTRAL